MQARMLAIEAAGKNWKAMRDKNTIKQANELQVLSKHDEYRKVSLDQYAEKIRKERHELFIKKIPLKFQRKTFEDFKAGNAERGLIKKIAERIVVSYPERQHEGLCVIMKGNPGTGKTMLACILAQKLSEAGFLVDYEPSLHFLRKWQEKNFESNSAFQALLDSYKRIQFLVIDEITEGFGKAVLADWEKQMLFTLIDMRYQNNLSTLVISRRSNAEMIERLSEPTTRRLAEKGLTLTFSWDAYRRNDESKKQSNLLDGN
jgi:DNA replication protein DnaC